MEQGQAAGAGHRAAARRGGGPRHVPEPQAAGQGVRDGRRPGHVHLRDDQRQTRGRRAARAARRRGRQLLRHQHAHRKPRK